MKKILGKISIVIPTLNAEKFIAPLIESILSQTIIANEIIIVDSQSADNTVSISKKYDNVRVIEIKKRHFNHGGTRNMAFNEANGEIVCFLTQDALPVNDRYIECLLAPLDIDSSIAMVSGRQVARNEASNIEKIARDFNYPPRSYVRDKSDIRRLGIKAYFTSDCCSAYRRSAYFAVGGFDTNILVNEDMKIAAKFLHAGYKIAYSAEAAVYHSHNYSLGQQYARYFDIGAFMKMNQKLWGNEKVNKEGARLAKHVLKRLIRKGNYFESMYFVIESLVKYIAKVKGSKYMYLSKRNILKSTMNKEYWINHVY